MAFNKIALRTEMLKKNISVKELAEELGMSRPTFYRKCLHDGNFDRSEIEKISSILGDNALKSIFFDSKVANTQQKQT